MGGLGIVEAANGWVVTHLRSGSVLGLEEGLVFKRIEQAERALTAFLGLADWRLPAGLLRRQRHVVEVGDLLCESIAAEVLS